MLRMILAASCLMFVFGGISGIQNLPHDATPAYIAGRLAVPAFFLVLSVWFFVTGLKGRRSRHAKPAS